MNKFDPVIYNDSYVWNYVPTHRMTLEDLNLIGQVLTRFGMYLVDTDHRDWLKVRAMKMPMKHSTYNREAAINALSLAGYHATPYFHSGLQISKP